MYPFLRMANEVRRFRKAEPLALTETHVSHHRCWPWDIDPWMELNNGRTLTLYDLGRIPMARRIGLVDAIRRRGWGLTVAGSCVRYRRRIHAFERFEMRSRAVGADHRFLYLEQSIWKQTGECANNAMYRTAVTGPNGIVSPKDVAAEMGHPELPDLPAHFTAWIAAEDKRPWPPMVEA